MEGTKTGQTRRRLNEQAWKVLMKRFDGAAMTAQEFRAREGLSLGSFRRWRAVGIIGLKLKRAKFHGEWNYTLLPSSKTT